MGAARGRPAGRPELSAKTEQALTISEMLMGAIESPEHELTLNTFSAETAKRARGRRLSTVQNMTDAFAQFGMNQGDKIDRRGQILMYRKRRERIKHHEWKMKRATDHDKKITRWRMRNNNRDMAHFHHMDGLRKPDFSIKPVLPERANAQRTGS